MAYSTISKPSLHFNTKLYTGNASTQAITGVGFQPDWTWIKNRSTTNSHVLTDAVRGVDKTLITNSNGAENAGSTNIGSFDSDGFTLGSNGGTNGSGNSVVSWNWKAGTTSGLSGGNITPSAYSYNATSGFGIYKYTGNGSADQTIPHGLGKKPQMIFYKNLSSGTNWVAQSNLLGNRVQLVLNGTDASNTDSRLGASDNWDTTNFNVGSYGDMNNNGSSYVAYVFCNIDGYSKIGTYTGNGTSGVDGAGDGTFVYTGFKPNMIIIKPTSTTGNWQILDNKRPGFNESDNLAPNNNAAENTSNDFVDLVSNGFKLRSGTYSASGVTYIYMAFAEEPLVANVGQSIPATAR